MIDDRDDKINENGSISDQPQNDNGTYEVNSNSESQGSESTTQEDNTNSSNQYEITNPEIENEEPVDNVAGENTNQDTVDANYNLNTQESQTGPQEVGTSNFSVKDNNWETQGVPSPAYNNYYKESFKKTNTKKSNAWKYVLVSAVSSLVGAALLALLMLFVAPVVQPHIKEYLGNNFPGLKTESTQPNNTGELKRVEIVQNGESAVTSVAEKVGPSVVGIKTTYQNSNELFGVQSEGGEGSGIIISADGYILTNHHVIEGALNDKTRGIRSDAKIEVFLPNRIDKPYSATVKGYDSKTDLAVLKINETNLPVIEFGNSDDIKVGEPAIAIGNPGGLEYMGSLTYGVISGLNRTVQLDGGKRIRLVQTDAAINPGNSGGALVNIKGQLIGVNTVKMVATGFEGLGFAIPVNEAKTIADELMTKTYIAKPYLGISVNQQYTEDIAKANNMPAGVYVADVELFGAAAKAGIMPGDVITKFNNKSVKSYDELEDIKNKMKPGDVVKIEIFRDGNSKTVQAKLGETK
ncbi:S1C family serine protease [Ruminiclostridium papyrosolvens]|uniref:Peptidase S1 n=1 Tax=Ruminiclostridium papyrosolvens C7 TaxID=1330534 RepID=U4R5C3_9FIRM|nr:trypsin-like peptidase domain-containing protein [Ruminiclostridium papyrosolvens]EPR13230.1 peptidase S1 [Ruminiclostridium papyrosolvens C7]